MQLNSNMVNYNVVGDVTGYGKTLLALINKMPKVPLIGLGDLIDRGPNSKLVLDIFIDNGFQSVMGNHDHMMLYAKIQKDPNVYWRLYHPNCWSWNGGHETCASFGFDEMYKFEVAKVDKKYWDFIENMPLKIEVGNFVLSHAPILPHEPDFFNLAVINKSEEALEHSSLWNRYGPYKPNKKYKEYAGKIQLYGHNSTKGVLWHTKKFPDGIYRDKHEEKDPAWAVCLDTWREGYLSGLHLPTMEVFKQELID
jgi:hypothetical protein